MIVLLKEQGEWLEVIKNEAGLAVGRILAEYPKYNRKQVCMALKDQFPRRQIIKEYDFEKKRLKHYTTGEREILRMVQKVALDHPHGLSMDTLINGMFDRWEREGATKEVIVLMRNLYLTKNDDKQKRAFVDLTVYYCVKCGFIYKVTTADGQEGIQVTDWWRNSFKSSDQGRIELDKRIRKELGREPLGLRQLIEDEIAAELCLMP